MWPLLTNEHAEFEDKLVREGGGNHTEKEVNF